MNLEQIVFRNRSEKELQAIVEFPAGRQPHNFALLLHCLDPKTSDEMRRSLVSKGFGLMSMDLANPAPGGEQDLAMGESDLLDAAAYLKSRHLAPTLLIGHSLGGAMVLAAAGSLPDARALALLGTPSDPLHLKRLLIPYESGTNPEGIRIQLGENTVYLAKSMGDKLLGGGLEEKVKRLRMPLLLMHSPQDTLVEIMNSENLYKAAPYPKSFLALEGTDHFLKDRPAAAYAAELISGWAMGFLEVPLVPGPETAHQVMASLDLADGFTTSLKLGNHYLTADEPVAAGGRDWGPSPYELLSASLAACTAMTLRMYASRKKWELSKVEVYISYSRQHQQDCDDCESPEARIDTFERTVQLSGQLSPEQRARLLEIADKCPVHKTLHSPTQVITSQEE